MISPTSAGTLCHHVWAFVCYRIQSPRLNTRAASSRPRYLLDLTDL